MSTEIYAGIGTDLYKYEDRIDAFFVDPSLQTDYGRICKCTFEEFVFNKIIINPLFFKDAVIKSDRMIEHIKTSDLFTYTLPIMANLCKAFGTQIELVFPDINRVTEWLEANVYYDNESHLEEDMFNHELCNIEAIAYGDHKTILTEDIIRGFFEYKGLKVESYDNTIDGKPFYKKIIVKNLDKGELNDIVMEKWYSSSHTKRFQPKTPALANETWELSNSILTECTKFAGMYQNERQTLRYYIYKSNDKLNYREDMFRHTDAYVDMCFLREKHFTHVDCTLEKVFNRIHPFCKIYTFQTIL